MIVSASRRTDVPALYPKWLLHRLACGFAEVSNPYRPSAVRRVDLRPSPNGDMEALVLWTRNPSPLLRAVPEWERSGVRTLWLITVTGYPTRLEPRVPETAEVLAAVQALARHVGRERIAWRYDPVFLAPRIGLDEAFHRNNFRRLARRLEPHVGRCILSTFDDYAKVRKRLAAVEAESDLTSAYPPVLQALAEEAQSLDLPLQSCAERQVAENLTAGACIDPQLLHRLWGLQLEARRDPGQRQRCRCAPSVDIGAYDTCTHGCRYCYASGSPERIAARVRHHEATGPRLA